LHDTRLQFAIGKANITQSFEEAIQRATVIVNEISHS
jgi:hypothetical protein